MEWIDFIPGAFNVLLCLAGCYQCYRLLKQLNAASESVSSSSSNCKEVMSSVEASAWYPLCTAVIANHFKISPAELDVEYRRDNEARRWIIRNVFPDNDLTRRFCSNYQSRFMNTGYDFKPAAKAADPAVPTRTVGGFDMGYP